MHLSKMHLPSPSLLYLSPSRPPQIRIQLCKKAGGGFGVPAFIAPGKQLGVYLHSTHSFGVGMNLQEDVDPIVEDASLQVRMGSAVYDKSPWQFMLDKVAKRSMRQNEKEKEAELLAKIPSFVVAETAKPEEDEDEDEDQGEESEDEQDALSLKVSFAGKLEYTLQAMAFADM
jgi:hypothetical protein